MSRKISNLLLAIIIGVAAIFRFTGINWDSSSHLHPDERFLTMVGVAMKIPQTFSVYMDPLLSTMNPANIGYVFYVYGLLPLTLNKILAVLSGSDTYEFFVLQGRMFSGFIDILAVVFIYKIVALIERHYELKHKSLKFWAAFIYAVSVLPIQLSHFFAVDTFLNTFGLMSVFFILKVLFMHREKKEEAWRVFLYTVLSSICWGLALSSKVTAVFYIPLITGFAVATFHKKYKWHLLGPAVALWLIVAYFTVRIVNPYMFESGNVFDFRLGTLYLKNLHELKGYEDPNSFFPPIVQWSHTPKITYSFYNLFMFAYGPIATLLTIAGALLVFKRKNYVLWVISAFSIVFFIYQATRMTQPVRYFNIVIPYFAILAAVAVVYAGDVMKRWKYLFIPLLLFWPVAFLSIYVQPHSRIAASEWIYRNIPPGSKIAVEHWDDALPITLDGARIAQNYTFLELPVFAPDSDANKWNTLYENLENADYYIMSSNRAWRSVMSAPDKYPVMSKFYKDLFAGRNKDYKQFGHFTSYPSYKYLGIPVEFPDNSADETFTVYDHPEVYIFERIKNKELRIKN